MCEKLKISEAPSLVTSEPLISSSFACPQSPLKFSQCFVPYLEPIKDKKYETLSKFEGNLKGEINNNNNNANNNNNTSNNNGEFHYTTNPPFSEVSKEKEVHLCMNNTEETTFVGESFSNYYETSFSREYNNYSYTSSEQAYSSSNFKSYAYDNTRSNVHHGTFDALSGNYVNNAYDNYYSHPNYATNPPEVRSHLPSENFNGPQSIWQGSSFPNSLYSPSDSTHFYPHEAYSNQRQCFNATQQHPFYNSLKPHVAKTRKETKSISSLQSTKNKRGPFIASLRGKRDINCTSISSNGKKNSYPIIIDKPSKSESSICPPSSNSRCKLPMTKPCDPIHYDPSPKTANIHVNKTAMKTVGSEKMVPEVNITNESSSKTSTPNHRLSEDKSPEVTNSLWEQVSNSSKIQTTDILIF